jgi:probable selenate reductase FAD-binding subunit
MKYLKPESIEQAVSYLKQGVPLAGGTQLTTGRAELDAVIDLRGLELDEFQIESGTVKLGAMLQLQRLIEHREALPPALIDSLRHESAWNLRNAATLGGTLACADGRSPFLTTLVAMAGRILLEPGGREMSVHEFLNEREKVLPGSLITGFAVGLPNKLAYRQVARSPMDQPIVCASAALQQDGSLSLALGGHGPNPQRLLEVEAQWMEKQDLGAARRTAETMFREAHDAFASAEYRSQVAGILIERVVREVTG